MTQTRQNPGGNRGPIKSLNQAKYTPQTGIQPRFLVDLANLLARVQAEGNRTIAVSVPVEMTTVQGIRGRHLWAFRSVFPERAISGDRRGDAIFLWISLLAADNLHLAAIREAADILNRILFRPTLPADEVLAAVQGVVAATACALAELSLPPCQAGNELAAELGGAHDH